MSNPANKIEKEEFFSLFENVVEYTPKVAEELIKLRPFSSDEALLESLSNVIEELSFDEKVRIILETTNKSCLINFTNPGWHSERPPRPGGPPGLGEPPDPGVRPGAARGRPPPPDLGPGAEAAEPQRRVQGQVRLHLHHLRQGEQGRGHPGGAGQAAGKLQGGGDQYRYWGGEEDCQAQI